MAKPNNNRSTASSSGRSRYVTASQVRQILIANAEVKRFASINSGNTNSTVGGVINLTNGIAQGDDLTQRTGDQIKILSHQVHVRASAITVNQSFRFILFKDNMNRGTTPAVTEVLNSANLMSQLNPITRQQNRFTVLKDIMLDCNVAGESIKNAWLKAKGHKVSFNGPTAVAASNGPGAVFLLTIGDSVTGQFDISYEASYTDL